jgi:hypothetical protein
MGLKSFKILMTIFWVGLGLTQTALGTTQGEYVGVFKHQNIEMDQLAKLNLIYSHDSNDLMVFNGILTLHFGGFEDHESVSYRFNSVGFNQVTNEIDFQESNQDLLLKTLTFEADMLELEAWTESSGRVGTFLLKKNATAEPTRDLMPPVEGEYGGTCEGEEQSLQLYTYRSSEPSQWGGNSFREFRVTGRSGRKNQSLCPNTSGLPCAMNVIDAGQFEFFDNHLILVGQQKSEYCSFNAKGIECDGCQLDRTSHETLFGSSLRPRRIRDSFAPQPLGIQASKEMEGTYKGYFHHQRHDTYQRGEIDIVSISSQGDGWEISANARLRFGGALTSEKVTYRFRNQRFKSSDQTIQLASANHEGRVRLRIESLDPNGIQGTWFSDQFGLVGRFYLKKNGPIELSRFETIHSGLAGSFNSEDMTLAVAVHRNATESESPNPFGQNGFSGSFYYKSGITARIPITGGSYDFFTGKIAFETDDGERAAVGTYDPEKDVLKLRWQTKKFGTLMQSNQWHYFRR